jgi:hypothetical protein
MKSSKFWIAVAAAGVAMNVVNGILQGMIMEKMYYSKHLDLFSMTANPAWFIFGDFVTVFVLAWVYDKVSSGFVTGWRGGAMYGFYAGGSSISLPRFSCICISEDSHTAWHGSTQFTGLFGR